MILTNGYKTRGSTGGGLKSDLHINAQQLLCTNAAQHRKYTNSQIQANAQQCKHTNAQIQTNSQKQRKPVKYFLGTLSEKNNGIMWGKFPNWGEGSDPNPLHTFRNNQNVVRI